MSLNKEDREVLLKHRIHQAHEAAEEAEFLINNKMKKYFLTTIISIFLLLFFLVPKGAEGCSMILAGKKATADGSVLLAHNNDLPGDVASLIQIVPAKKYQDSATISFKNGLQIPQASQTFRMLIMNCYYGFAEGDAVAINQYQVAIAGGVSLKDDRNDKARELDPLVKKGVSGYIRYIALQRAKTARECVQIIGEMYSKYGISYPSGVGVADANEAWYLEAGGGRCWVAQRVPDNAYIAVTNGYRIGVIDFDDKENVIYPPYLKDFAVKKGLWNPKEKLFHFARIFGGKREKENSYYNARRVWRMQKLLNPSNDLNPDHFTHPIMLKPEKKITLKMLFAILRDYYQGTPYDITEEEICVPGVEKERPIALFNTVHTNVIQLRNNMPADIGGVMWAGVGSPLAVIYIPYYLGINHVPEPYCTAGAEFDPQSAFWQFRRLSRLSEAYFPTFKKALYPFWQPIENSMLGFQDQMERETLEMYKKQPQRARQLLTDYTNGLATKTLDLAKSLKDDLLVDPSKITEAHNGVKR